MPHTEILHRLAGPSGRLLAGMIAGLLLASCAGAPPLPSGSLPPAKARKGSPAPPPVAATDAPQGVDIVMGRSAGEVIGALGPPTLDRSEGAGRHLQFAYGPCIVDVYLFGEMAAEGTPMPPVARYAEARRLDGSTMEAGGCIDAQRRLLARPR